MDNRIRFTVEAARRTAAAIGSDKVGIRLSPYGVFNGTVADAQTDAVYTKLTQELSKLKLLYIHVIDHSAMGAPKPKPELIHAMRAADPGGSIDVLHAGREGLHRLPLTAPSRSPLGVPVGFDR